MAYSIDCHGEAPLKPSIRAHIAQMIGATAVTWRPSFDLMAIGVANASQHRVMAMDLLLGKAIVVGPRCREAKLMVARSMYAAT